MDRYCGAKGTLKFREATALTTSAYSSRVWTQNLGIPLVDWCTTTTKSRWILLPPAEKTTTNKGEKIPKTRESTRRRKFLIWAPEQTPRSSTCPARITPPWKNAGQSNQSNFIRSCDQMLWRIKWTLWWYNNQIHFLSFSTDISSNEVFTYKEAMNQEDTHLFVEAMQNEVADHELWDHWTIVPCSTVPKTTKPNQAIWSFEWKWHPDGTLVKHKARMCAHGGMQQWGTNYWETYSPVVNMVTVRLILLLPEYTNLTQKLLTLS